MPTTRRYGLQAAIFTNRLADAMKAFAALDYGGVLVNEVPTWRADQQPYGGLRDSGNTREGPAYAVREMTELKMVVLSPSATLARRHPTMGGLRVFGRFGATNVVTATKEL